ncbi:hypothetical protein CEG88_13100 [Klebsiella aerogenes]|nr:hypothetical protein B8043_09430 [Klebsiella aerogenes]OWP43183.1 hypothetical protein CEG88_13100 [Klebsiella aerogenes]PYZ48395.1 hypothetical protein DNK66_22045 [Klebsiella aerogenes]
MPLIYSPRWLTLLVLVISKPPGGAAAYRGYSALRFGSPDKAQRAASGKRPGGSTYLFPLSADLL